MRLPSVRSWRFAAALVLAPAAASAQTTDVRLIRPNVMFMVDNSGSMEWRNSTLNASCTGVDGGACNRCSNGVSICSTLCPAAESRNRWTTMLEVLTGTISRFSCVEVPRNDPSQYDYLVPIPHHQPLSNGLPLWRPGASQATDGILDTYANTVRFGLMTFDNDARVGLGPNDGMYSYGDRRNYRPVGCADTTVVNLGIRRASTDGDSADPVPGGLIAPGDPALDSTSLTLVNQRVQQSLVGRPASGTILEAAGLRPWGGTPVAAMLDDAAYFWLNHQDVRDPRASGSGDPYFRCRRRANILITDGQPNMDFRPFCVGGECPYAPADQSAMTMLSRDTTPTYVIAFNASDTGAATALTPIAMNGGTSRVYYANDRPTLSSALATVLDSISSFTSTRVPSVFGQAGSSSATGTSQYRFSGAFNITPGLPRSGSLTRFRTVCQAPMAGADPIPTDVPPDAAAGDDLANNLRAVQRSTTGVGPRFLWTFVPTGATTASPMQAAIVNTTGSLPGAAAEITSGMPPGLFGYTTSSEVSNFTAWLRGDTGTVRADRPLGDIFHSVPLYVPAPSVSLPDQSFTAFRLRPLPNIQSGTGRARSGYRAGGPAVTVGTREPMLYVGTNDGIMHAFDMDSGQEVWGFVPPALMPRLYTRFPNVPQRGVDGSPVVKEVVFQRSGTALGDDASWHTVLLFGLGRGATTDSGIGSAYIAMDVTDPYNPKLLWQFTDPELGDTFGSPTIGTLFYRLPSTGENVERAVAFLPGGGSDLVAGCTTPRPVSGARGWTGWSGGRGARRPTVRCWRNTVSTATANRGQWLYVVDLATGQLIRKIGAGSRGTTATVTPITGTPALYNGVSGAVTSRVYVGDADGTIWRADVSSRDQNEWYMAEAWDLFWDATAPGAVQPVYERPAVTVDRDGRLHIAAGSGDPDFLEGMDANRIASFSERASTDPASGAVTALTLEANWELGVGGRVADRDLYLGERLTGPLTIHNNSLYFGTFVPRTSADPCEVGFARLWGVDMSATDSAAGAYAPKARLDLDGNPATTGDIVRVTTDLNNNTLADDSNSVLYGVTVERQPDCNVNSSVTDPLTGLSRPYVSSTSGGGYRLVVQTGAGSTGIGSVRSYRFANLPAPRYPTRVDAWATVFE